MRDLRLEGRKGTTDVVALVEGAVGRAAESRWRPLLPALWAALVTAFLLVLAQPVFALPGDVGDETTDATLMRRPADAPPQAVEVCLRAEQGPGRMISGFLPGEGAITAPARVLNVTLRGSEQAAFCTDINNQITPGQCYADSVIGAIQPRVACLLQFYDPADLSQRPTELSADQEAAARQAAVWHFSDGFALAGAGKTEAAIYDRYLAILADVEAKYASGACAAWALPSLQLAPSAGVSALIEDGAGGYQATPYTLTLSVRIGDWPMAHWDVAVETDLGELQWNGRHGQSLRVQTDAQGQATVIVAHQAAGTATIVATVDMALPLGVRFDPGPDVQKIVLKGGIPFSFRAQATVQWVAPAELTVMAFDDQNLNGAFDPDRDRMLAWPVSVCAAGGACTQLATVADRPLRLAVDPGQTYTVCQQMSDANWLATTATCQTVQPPAAIGFGAARLPVLVVEAYEDRNANGQREADEPMLTGWGVGMVRREGIRWSQKYSGLAVAATPVAFTGVARGLYRVDQFMSAERGAFSGGSQQIEVNEDRVYTISFAYQTGVQQGSPTALGLTHFRATTAGGAIPWAAAAPVLLALIIGRRRFRRVA